MGLLIGRFDDVFLNGTSLGPLVIKPSDAVRNPNELLAVVIASKHLSPNSEISIEGLQLDQDWESLRERVKTGHHQPINLNVVTLDQGDNTAAVYPQTPLEEEENIIYPEEGGTPPVSPS